MKIEITKEEAKSGVTQLEARLNIFNHMIAENEDNSERVDEIVKEMKPIESLKNKLLKAYSDSTKEESHSDCLLRAVYLGRWFRR